VAFVRRIECVPYPVAIEPGTETEAFGVVVPDLPGCYSAGDTMEEAMAKAEEAIVAWIETALDSGQVIPQPSSVDALRKKHREWKAWVWAVVKVDPAVLDDKLERVNISLPRRVLHRLDALARAMGETRSGFIARMVMENPRAIT
jgi:predicted RNase H-like HicB family nuclease